MNGIYFLFGTIYSNARGIATNSLYKVILTVIATNGIPESVVAGILIAAIGKVLLNTSSFSRTF